MSEAEATWVHRTSGGGCYSVLLVFGVFPWLFLGEALALPRLVTAAGVWTAVALAVVVWRGVRSETRLEIDATKLRLSERETVFGVPRATQTIWELPRAELTQAKEVHTRTPSSRGGWSHAYVLRLPGDRTVRDGQLGGREDPSSGYAQFARWLRAHLNERFTTEEKL